MVSVNLVRSGHDLVWFLKGLIYVQEWFDGWRSKL